MAVGIAAELLRKQTGKNSNWDEPIFYGNKEMTFKLFTFKGYRIRYLQLNKCKHSLEGVILFELPFDICQQTGFVQSACLKHILSKVHLHFHRQKFDHRRQQIKWRGGKYRRRVLWNALYLPTKSQKQKHDSKRVRKSRLNSIFCWKGKMLNSSCV